MIAPSDCAVMVLAAGQSHRFGRDDKLLAPFQSRPLLDHILSTASAFNFARKIAVISSPKVAAIAQSRGFSCVSVERGHPMGASLRAGAQSLGNTGSALILLGDMPFVSSAHIYALLAAASADDVMATSAPDYLGPPVLVPCEVLSSLDPAMDQGAKAWLTNAEAVEAGEHEVVDIDTQAALSGW